MIADVTAALIIYDTLNSCVQDWREGTVTPCQCVQIIVLPVLDYRLGVEFLVGIFLQAGSIQPALHARSAFIGLDESDRYLKTPRQHTSKEIARRRLLRHILHVGRTPPAVGIVQRTHTLHTWYLTPAQTFIIDSVSHDIIKVLHRAVAEAFDGHLHITLARADPHITGKDVLDGRSSVAVIECYGQRCVAGSRRLHREDEASVLTCRRLHLFRRPAGRHRNRLLRRCPSPKMSIGILLYHHSVRQQVWQPHLCLSLKAKSGNNGRKY